MNDIVLEQNIKNEDNLVAFVSEKKSNKRHQKKGFIHRCHLKKLINSTWI